MTPPSIVKPFDIIEYICLGVFSCRISLPSNTFTLQQGKEALYWRIIVTTPTTTHAAFNTMLAQQTTKVIARIQGEDFRSGANSRHTSGPRMPGRVFRWIGGSRQDFEVRKRLATLHRCLPYRSRIGYHRKALASLSGRRRRSRGISYPQKSTKKLKGTDHVFLNQQGQKWDQILNPE